MTETEPFLFIMDPAETLNLETETSLLLMAELITRGVPVYWAEAGDLILRQNTLQVRARRVRGAMPLERDEALEMWTGDFGAVLLRTDPPVDEAYLQLTYLLDFLPGHVHQFNRISALRDLNEKLLPLYWPDLVPPTLTTMNAAALEAFVEEHGTAVLKPLGDCSGRGITRVSTSDRGWRESVQSFIGAGGGRRMVQVQAFLPEVTAGDKRVFLLNGNPIGAVNRVPRDGAYLANIHQGARVENTRLTGREREAVARIAPLLKARGLMLVGADFIGGQLTELNITSPSAVRQINAVMGAQLEVQIVEAMLAAVSGDRSDNMPGTGPMAAPDTGSALCCA
ncbi:hypothetical protein ACFO5Q_00365 [Kordiimonas lipolytica]|uniref:Glutathione synthetase n=1 Tax=Kordiimonas lipolytica TaxID=1662421 RepID=A0ABV8U516_9PROT|nr:hypothetical protein [Kordiimonas lipolytica]